MTDEFLHRAERRIADDIVTALPRGEEILDLAAGIAAIDEVGAGGDETARFAASGMVPKPQHGSCTVPRKSST